MTAIDMTVLENSTNVRNKHATRRLRDAALAAAASIAPGLAVRHLERSFLTPEAKRFPRAAEPAFRGASLMKVLYDGRWLQTYAWGRGPTVLLVHGWSGHAAQFAPLATAIREAGFRVVTYDAPGHGASDGGMTNLVDLAGAVAAVARNMGPIHAVVAHSAGAAAAALAVKRGLPVSRLAFLAPSRDLAADSRRLARAHGIPRSLYARFEARLEARVGARLEDLTADKSLAGHRGPLLVIHDRNDRSVSYRDGERLARSVDGSRMIPTEGLGHRRILGDSQVAATIVDFLYAVERRKVA